MKKRLTLSVLVLVLVFLDAVHIRPAHAQEIFLPVKGQLQRVRPFPVIQNMANLVLDPTGAPVGMVTIVPDVLFAIPNPVVGQQAVDACNAGTTQPPVILGPFGTPVPTTCADWQQKAITDDINARVKAAINTVTVTVLTQQNLWVEP